MAFCVMCIKLKVLCCCAVAAHWLCRTAHVTFMWVMQAEARQHKCPHVANFLDYVKFRWMVSFRKLEDPKARHARVVPCLSRGGDFAEDGLLGACNRIVLFVAVSTSVEFLLE